MRALAVLFALAFAVAHVQAAPPDLPGASKQWAADWSAKNLDAVMRLYAPEATFLPTVGPRWDSPAAIRKNCAGLLATYNPRIAVHSLRSAASGDLGYDTGAYEETIVPVKGGKPISAAGSYLFLFQRQKDGAWKILEQTFTELAPVNL